MRINRIWESLTSSGTVNGQTLAVTAVSGGCINSAYRVDTDQGSFFLKVNHASRYPGMFRTEQMGLELLRSPDALRVPRPLAVGEADGQQYLLCEWVSQAAPAVGHDELLGRGLAEMHQVSDTSFGLDHDNWIGSLPQTNTRSGSWSAFFSEQRIMPQLRLAEQQGLLTPKLRESLDKLMARLPTLFPDEPPSLIHGDLWAGNVMADESGRPVIFDPAAYFGHREMDIGMMHLFGGFGRRVFDSYNEAYPLAPDWQSRIALCQIYPLLVHVNLFGAVYIPQAETAIRPFI